MSIHIKTNGVWKTVREPRVKDNEEWKDLKAVHIKHEGQWRMVWSRWAPIDGRLVGIVSSGDFISGNALASSIGLSAGTAHNSTCDWLHFELEGQTIMIPQLTLRYNLTWRDIYVRGAVYSDTTGHGPYPGGSGVNQNRYVTIGGTQYKVTLLKGANAENVVHNYGHLWEDNHTDARNYDPSSTHQSEWNKLMYRLAQDGGHDLAPNPASHPYGIWEEWDNTQMGLTGNGGYSWCQEKGTRTGHTNDLRVRRGGRGVSSVFCTPVARSHSGPGWRPALRKM